MAIAHLRDRLQAKVHLPEKQHQTLPLGVRRRQLGCSELGECLVGAVVVTERQTTLQR